jgi:23S rRNA (guanosine2251-2'-O)-methyltransferase
MRAVFFFIFLKYICTIFIIYAIIKTKSYKPDRIKLMERNKSHKPQIKKHTPREGRFEKNVAQEEIDENIVFGRNAVKELLSGGRDIEKIFISKGEREGSINLLIGQAKERGIPVFEHDRVKLDSISAGGRHQGIVAFAAQRNYSTVDEILSYAEEKGEKPFIVICDGVEDPHNLGAIIRSAECCGAHGVIIPKRRAVGLTTTVAKASAGAIEHMLIAKVTNIAATIKELKDKGLWIYAADMDGESYYETDLSGASAIVLGSEGFGISRLVKENCDFVVSIPLFGRVNSMNVSCASAIIFAEVARQRHKEA